MSWSNCVATSLNHFNHNFKFFQNQFFRMYTCHRNKREVLSQLFKLCITPLHLSLSSLSLSLSLSLFHHLKNALRLQLLKFVTHKSDRGGVTWQTCGGLVLRKRIDGCCTALRCLTGRCGVSWAWQNNNTWNNAHGHQYEHSLQWKLWVSAQQFRKILFVYFWVRCLTLENK